MDPILFYFHLACLSFAAKPVTGWSGRFHLETSIIATSPRSAYKVPSKKLIFQDKFSCIRGLAISTTTADCLADDTDSTSTNEIDLPTSTQLEVQSSNDQGRSFSVSAPPVVQQGTWMVRYHEMYEFQQKHGHCLVPKRYKANPVLGNWVSKQRQQYRRYCQGIKPNSMTDKKVAFLNRLGFCWDASNKHKNKRESSVNNKGRRLEEENQELEEDNTMISTSVNRRNVSERIDSFPGDVCDSLWLSRLEEVKSYLLEHNITIAELPRQTRLGNWIHKQREDYNQFQTQKLLHHAQEKDGVNVDEYHSRMSKRMKKFEVLKTQLSDHHWWMNRRERQWEQRLSELQVYRDQYGDCCVPISYSANPQLANWVSRMRKQYKTWKPLNSNETAGKDYSSLEHWLVEDRFERLKAIGFVWDRWEYEFKKKLRDNGGTNPQVCP